MKTILIYFALFTFWAEKTLGFKLTHMVGASLANLSMYLLLIAWALSVFNNRKLFKENNLNVYLILLIVSVAISIPIKIVLAEIPNISLSEEIIALKSWINPFLFFFIIYNLVDNEKTCKGVIFALMILLILSVVTMQLVTYDLITLGTIRVTREGRSFGFSEANQYAAYLVLMLPLFLSVVLFEKRMVIKIATAFIYFGAVVGLVITGSRGGLIAFFFSIAAYIVFLMREKMIATSKIPLILCFCVSVGIGSFLFAPTHVKHTLIEKADFSKSKDMYEFTSGRTLLLRKGIELFTQSPVFGHGQNVFMPLMITQFRIKGVSHNEYLTYLVNQGIVGFILFVIIYIQIYRHLSYHLKTTKEPFVKLLYLSYLSGFTGYVVAMLGVNLFAPRTLFWVYTAILYSYSSLPLKSKHT